MKRHCRRPWKSAAVACIVEMKPGIVVVVGMAKAVDVVSKVELKAGAVGAAGGIGAAKIVIVARRVELKAAAGVAGIETTKTADVAGVLLNILRPHAGTGDTGLERNATNCVAQRVVVGVIGGFGFVAIRRAKIDLQVGNNP
jgi:hypothetical protein